MELCPLKHVLGLKNVWFLRHNENRLNKIHKKGYKLQETVLHTINLLRIDNIDCRGTVGKGFMKVVRRKRGHNSGCNAMSHHKTATMLKLKIIVIFLLLSVWCIIG